MLFLIWKRAEGLSKSHGYNLNPTVLPTFSLRIDFVLNGRQVSLDEVILERQPRTSSIEPQVCPS